MCAGLRFCLLFSLIACGGAANAVELLPGKMYQGPQQIESRELGLAFVLPEGFRGMLGADAEFFVAESTAMTLLVYADRLQRGEILGLMQAPIPLDALTRLEPATPVAEEDGWFSADYAVSGRAGLSATLGAAASDAGIGLVFIAVGDDMSRLKNLVGLLQRTAVLGKPEARANGSWAQELNNQVIKRFFRGSGYYEEFALALCADGRFYRATTSGGFGGGAGGVYAGDAQGTWSASGQTSSRGELRLEHGAGAVFSGSTTGSDWQQSGPGGEARDYRLEYRDGGLHLDGARWYWSGAADC